MKFGFLNPDYEDLYNGINKMNYHQDLVTGFLKKIQVIESAPTFSDLYAMKGLHLEKLKGDKMGFMSMRINDKRRLIFSLEDGGENQKIWIKCIEDYH